MARTFQSQKQMLAKEGRSLLKLFLFNVVGLFACMMCGMAVAQGSSNSGTVSVESQPVSEGGLPGGEARQRVEGKIGAMADGDRVDPYAGEPEPIEQPEKAKRTIGGSWQSGSIRDSNGNAPARATGSSGAGGVGSGLLGTLGALGVVIALIFGGRWAWARVGGRVIATGSSPVVEVLSRTSIGARSQVLLLRVGARVLVVSETPTGTRTLSEFDQDEEVAELLTRVESAKADSVSGGFRDVMSEINQQYNPLQASQPSSDDGRTGLKTLLAKMRSMNPEPPVRSAGSGGSGKTGGRV